jgi:hypothetical protein
MSTTITTVHVNAVSPEREEEFTNWYNYVHLRDVMGMPGHISAQRFWRAECQPKQYDPTYKFFTLYELSSKEESTKSHLERIMSWQLYISSAMDFRNYKESYWDLAYGSDPYSMYAEFGSENHNLVALIRSVDDKASVEQIFTPQVVEALGRMDGIYAANLYRFGTDQMPKQTASKEPFTHELILQLKDAPAGCASWDDFAARTPELAHLEISICNYVSIMPRLKACDRWDTPQDRAIAALYHMFVSLPGYHSGGQRVKQTDVLTPALKDTLEALKDK